MSINQEIFLERGMKERKGETPALEESPTEGQERFRCRVDTHTHGNTHARVQSVWSRGGDQA